MDENVMSRVVFRPRFLDLDGKHPEVKERGCKDLRKDNRNAKRIDYPLPLGYPVVDGVPQVCNDETTTW